VSVDLISCWHACVKKFAASVDEGAFKRIPELGPTPDMIGDDLPTNPDYLDESFGTAAGFRELYDGDVEDFEEEDIIGIDPVPVTRTLQPGIISSVKGETIKMLRSEGISVIEHFFDTLPPESETNATE
jgi:autophagy-related protein 2